MIEAKNIKIVPIKQLYVIAKEEKEIAAIVMSSYDVDNDKLNGIKNVTLTFDDLKKEDNRSFNRNNANIIHTFIDDIREKYSELYICCDSGESRSSAIAAATYKYFGVNDMPIWKNCHYNPNQYVYKLMCNEYGIEVSDIRLKYNSYVNKVSLKKQIKKSR